MAQISESEEVNLAEHCNEIMNCCCFFLKVLKIETVEIMLKYLICFKRTHDRLLDVAQNKVQQSSIIELVKKAMN